MRPTLKPQYYHESIADYFMSGKKVTQVPVIGDCVRPNDGESWKTINENSYKIRMDKGESQ